MIKLATYAAFIVALMASSAAPISPGSRRSADRQYFVGARRLSSPKWLELTQWRPVTLLLADGTTATESQHLGKI
jgi:hypothetical protein